MTFIFGHLNINTNSANNSSKVNKLIDSGENLKILANGISANKTTITSEGLKNIIPTAANANAIIANKLLDTMLTEINASVKITVRYICLFCFITVIIIVFSNQVIVLHQKSSFIASMDF